MLLQTCVDVVGAAEGGSASEGTAGVFGPTDVGPYAHSVGMYT